jgi:hypothetical protein
MPEYSPIHYYSQVSNTDINDLYELLEHTKFPKNYTATQNNKLEFKTASNNLGFIWSRTQLRYGKPLKMELSEFSKKHPELMIACAKLCRTIDPNFDFSTIQVNHNCVCMPHVDSANVGESILVSFGNYSGGELNVKDGDTIHCINTHMRPIRFNGSTHWHWNNSLEGNKYSLVFYNRSKPNCGNAHIRIVNYADILFNPTIEPEEVYVDKGWFAVKDI